MSEPDLMDSLELLQRATEGVVTDAAAWVIWKLFLPKDIEEVNRQLEDAGIGGTPEGESLRAQVLNALKSIKRQAEAWELSAKTPAVPVQRESEAVKEPVTRSEAAKMMGISKERVGQLLRRGALRGSKVDGQWLIDRASVEARPERTAV